MKILTLVLPEKEGLFAHLISKDASFKFPLVIEHKKVFVVANPHTPAKNKTPEPDIFVLNFAEPLLNVKL